ncbi:hypothetical protein GCM10009837_24610 [Streptomyces durmitorensis]
MVERVSQRQSTGGSRKYPAAETAETVTFPTVSPLVTEGPLRTELSTVARVRDQQEFKNGL